MKLWLKHLLILGVLATVIGTAVMLSGIIPIKASSGHWTVTKWFLDFSMARSVSTHSSGIAVPQGLENRAMIVRGAGHFETGCVQCHGSPERAQSPVAAAMTPRPPDLAGKIHLWEPQELFYIVRHGVKFTGMPAWAAPERDDEVWPIVAFLKQLPELNGEDYRTLVYGSGHDSEQETDNELEPEVRHLVAVTCARCHGVDGMGRDGIFPVLAGQRRDYLADSLRAYAAGERSSGMMEPLAVPLADSEIQALADYYGQLESGLNRNAIEPIEDREESDEIAGAEIAQSGVPSRRIPACNGCHDPALGTGYPLLGGQSESYMTRQLNLFRERIRGGTENAHLMHPATERIVDDDIRSVAEFYARARITTGGSE